MKFADQARQAVRELSRNGQRPVTRQDLGDRLGIQTRQDMRRVDTAVKALVKSGDLEMQGDGVYRWTGQAAQPSKQEVMWRYLRSRRAVTADELQEVSGAASDYVREWLRLLVSQKLVRREGENFRLVKDPGPAPPRNEGKAEYLKRRRQRQKEALAKIDAAWAAIAEARMAVVELEE